MSGLEFTSNLISAIAWPIAVLLAIIVLRRPLGGLGRIKTLRAFGGEVDLEARTAAVERAAAEVVASERRK